MDKIIEYFRAGGENINENKYFIGFSMILLNIGARFIIDELDEDLRTIVSHSYFRKFLIFSSIFMATRDIFTSFTLTIVIVIIINELFGKEIEEKTTKNEGGSYNKDELNKTINKLKEIQSTM